MFKFTLYKYIRRSIDDALLRSHPICVRYKIGKYPFPGQFYQNLKG